MSTGSHSKEQRRFYLEDIPLAEALVRFVSDVGEAGGLVPTAPERVALEEALGRVTAEPVWARISSPHYHAAAMDGAAIRAEDTSNASERAPVRLRMREQAQWVDTGMPLPPGFDAVVMIENIHVVEDGLIEVMLPVAPWQHVRLMGEDIVASELLLPEGHLLKPPDLGAIVQAGLTHVEVRLRPQVAIIPTGTELVSPGGSLKPGNIIESNSLVLAGLIKEWGGVATRFSPIPDEYVQLKQVIQNALTDHDVVVINAGASAGRRDFTASLVADLGKVIAHGVAIRPGHPVVLGVVDGKPVIGVPGYPVSAVLTMELFVKPLVYRLQGMVPPQRPTVEAVMTRKVFSPMGEDEFLRVKVGKVGNELLATPLQRGAGVTMSLVRADGLVRIPRGCEGLQEHQTVRVEIFSSLEEIENAIVIVGSHDLALDVLANQLHKQYPQRSLSSSNVGSLGGLLALKRREAHLAGSHLLDEDSGEYNVPYVKRLLGDQEIFIVNLVYREQGLMVKKGNPKGIGNLADLGKQEVGFINRQRGAGTRVLLDFKLKELGIAPEQIKGYDRVAFTHLAVAAAVASGAADAGLGILTAARALDLDFVPVVRERYDLIIPRACYESPLLEPLLAILQQPSFKAEVEQLGGYDACHMGETIARLPM
ncbi:MAG: molybdopterin biosynthesis protein [Chloroflexi bacterium RBG_13_53_26]|nr:MAG: molybdopterin biosynthesis protein [Chloroflexi bacterium RBG_13_53_26]